MLEHRALTDNERFNQLESQLKEARNTAEDADRKYDEVGVMSKSSFEAKNAASSWSSGVNYVTLKTKN